MQAKSFYRTLIIGAATGALATALFISVGPEWRAEAHKAKHTPQQLQAFQDQFMEQVKIGDSLFHGDKDLEKQMGVNLSNTGMACAMCHPYASDVHPGQFPKWQEQMSKFATLRDMINWCIEKPNQGEKLEDASDAMKALEAYIYWSNRGSPLEAGVH
jgi:thiosulfate dehydrogenase